MVPCVTGFSTRPLLHPPPHPNPQLPSLTLTTPPFGPSTITPSATSWPVHPKTIPPVSGVEPERREGKTMTSGTSVRMEVGALCLWELPTGIPRGRMMGGPWIPTCPSPASPLLLLLLLSATSLLSLSSSQSLQPPPTLSRANHHSPDFPLPTRTPCQCRPYRHLPILR